jgi:hypothetical protein
MIGGVILFLRGVTGSTGFVAEFIGMNTKLTDAAPGVVLFVIGLLMVWITRPDVRVYKDKNHAERKTPAGKRHR